MKFTVTSTNPTGRRETDPSPTGPAVPDGTSETWVTFVTYPPAPTATNPGPGSAEMSSVPFSMEVAPKHAELIRSEQNRPDAFWTGSPVSASVTVREIVSPPSMRTVPRSTTCQGVGSTSVLLPRYAPPVGAKSTSIGSGSTASENDPLGADSLDTGPASP